MAWWLLGRLVCKKPLSCADGRDSISLSWFSPFPLTLFCHAFKDVVKIVISEEYAQGVTSNHLLHRSLLS